MNHHIKSFLLIAFHLIKCYFSENFQAFSNNGVEQRNQKLHQTRKRGSKTALENGATKRTIYQVHTTVTWATCFASFPETMNRSTPWLFLRDGWAFILKKMKSGASRECSYL